MSVTTVPRSIAKLEYSAVRLPFTVLEEHVVARYLDDEALLRLGFEHFLGSLDGLAGRLLADDDLARRGHALRRRTEFLATAQELDAKAQLRRTLADEQLRAEQAAAGQQREHAQEQMEDKIAAARRQELEDEQRVSRIADARAKSEKAQVRRTAGKRVAKAEETKQAKQKRISAKEGRAAAAHQQELADAAQKRKAAKDRRQKAARLDQAASTKRASRRSR
jgi:hypothetical protein